MKVSHVPWTFLAVPQTLSVDGLDSVGPYGTLSCWAHIPLSLPTVRKIFQDSPRIGRSEVLEIFILGSKVKKGLEISEPF